MRGTLAEVPVDPDAGEARRWLLDELTKAQYQQSQPNWLDRVATGFIHWLTSLSLSANGGPPWVVFVVVAVVVLVGLGVAFLVFGAPRRSRRSAITGSLFGEDDDRNAAAMRASAESAAARGEFALAIAERYRAIARDLAERTVLTVSPGTTARDFSAKAARAFPASIEPLADAAAAFDEVRYLGGSGTAEQYARMMTLDAALQAARPQLEPLSESLIDSVNT